MKIHIHTHESTNNLKLICNIELYPCATGFRKEGTTLKHKIYSQYMSTYTRRKEADV